VWVSEKTEQTGVRGPKGACGGKFENHLYKGFPMRFDKPKRVSARETPYRHDVIIKDKEVHNM